MLLSHKMFDQGLILRHEHIITQRRIEEAIAPELLPTIRSLGVWRQDFDDDGRIEQDIAIFIMKLWLSTDMTRSG